MPAGDPQAPRWTSWAGSLPEAAPFIPPATEDEIAQWALEDERDRYRTALQQIASADLKRCSAGWLRDMAKKVLGETT